MNTDTANFRAKHKEDLDWAKYEASKALLRHPGFAGIALTKESMEALGEFFRAGQDSVLGIVKKALSEAKTQTPE